MSLLQMSKITDQTLEILKNKEILAINQDSVYGQSISPFRWGTYVSHRSFFLMQLLTRPFGTLARLCQQPQIPCSAYHFVSDHPF
jgi:hypothetical protein